jgi:hypothetical protein
VERTVSVRLWARIAQYPGVALCSGANGKALLLRQTIRQTSKLSGCAKGRLRRRHIEALLRSIAGACIADSSPRLTPKGAPSASYPGQPALHRHTKPNPFLGLAGFH